MHAGSPPWYTRDIRCGRGGGCSEASARDHTCSPFGRLALSASWDRRVRESAWIAAAWADSLRVVPRLVGGWPALAERAPAGSTWRARPPLNGGGMAPTQPPMLQLGYVEDERL